MDVSRPHVGWQDGCLLSQALGEFIAAREIAEGVYCPRTLQTVLGINYQAG